MGAIRRSKLLSFLVAFSLGFRFLLTLSVKECRGAHYWDNLGRVADWHVVELELSGTCSHSFALEAAIILRAGA